MEEPSNLLARMCVYLITAPSIKLTKLHQQRQGQTNESALYSENVHPRLAVVSTCISEVSGEKSTSRSLSLTLAFTYLSYILYDSLTLTFIVARLSVIHFQPFTYSLITAHSHSLY